MPSALVLYHYLYPDDVAGAVQMSELCAGLVERGWTVTAMPCRRGWWDEFKTYPARSAWKGVRIERAWRPRFRQSSALGRLLNAVWMLARWGLVACNPRRRPDVVVIGTDPVLGVLVVFVWRLFKPRTKIAFWCFDLYPEAAYAEGVLQPGGLWASMLRALLVRAYSACDLIVDIGPCMRGLLDSYPGPARRATLVPWALHEPSALPELIPADRAAIFGDSRLAILYSGNFGRAHSLDDLLDLARRLRGTGVHLGFSIRGSCSHAARHAVTAADVNISFVEFSPVDGLESRLTAADIHVVTLRDEFTGAVVPSKFFGALAVGRPVLFCGNPRSAIAIWIQQYGLGWVLPPGNAAAIAEALTSLLATPGELERMQRHCHRVYREHFGKAATLDHWDAELRHLLGESRSCSQEKSDVSTPVAH